MGNDKNFTDRDGIKVAKTTGSDPISCDVFMDSLENPDEKDFFELVLNYENKDSAHFRYLVRGALLRCDYGSHPRKLNLPVCHAVYSEDAPVVHDKDCEVGDEKNISTFGICDSPKLASEIESGKNIFQKWFKSDKILLVSEDGKSNIKGYPCTPVIVGGKWLNSHPHTLIAKNCLGAKFISPENRTYYPALTTDSFLVCKFCGLIEPENSGQDE